MDNVISMHSQALLGIFIAVVLFLFVLFLRQRNAGVQQPHRLYLKKKLGEGASAEGGSLDGQSSGGNPTGGRSLRNAPEIMSREVFEQTKVGPREKNLNVLFMFNGHSFDAHEVLGIPAGASRKMIEEAYVIAQAKTSGPKEFIEAAYQALIINLKQ